MAKSTCSIVGCEKPERSRGWCNKHYVRWLKHGSPLGRVKPSIEERFWEQVDRSGDCWIWTAGKFGDGYGSGWDGRAHKRAHRMAYEFVVGPIPEGMVLDHLCRNPPCVNPAHLEPVTQTENVLRGFAPMAINARKTHCPQGHPYDEANTRRTKQGHRKCRACARERIARVRANQHALLVSPDPTPDPQGATDER